MMSALVPNSKFKLHVHEFTSSVEQTGSLGITGRKAHLGLLNDWGTLCGCGLGSFGLLSLRRNNQLI